MRTQPKEPNLGLFHEPVSGSTLNTDQTILNQSVLQFLFQTTQADLLYLGPDFIEKDVAGDVGEGSVNPNTYCLIIQTLLLRSYKSINHAMEEKKEEKN